MNAMRPVVTVGDGIIDAVARADGPPVLFPGGAGLNLAVGLARLGLPSVLAARIGLDRHGQRLMRHLREEGVTLINTRNTDYTGVATSERRDGEPSFHFTPSVFRRRIGFDQRLLQVIESAPAVAVNSFSFHTPGQAEALAVALDRAAGLRVLDPNPRPRLIGDFAAFRDGFARALRKANLVKLSVEDAQLLYAREDDGLAAMIFAHGVDALVLTRGRLGASVFTRSGLAASVPAATFAAPIVDTMGAGDATLASIVATILLDGMPDSNDSWQGCLRRAMDVAGATCRSVGGALVRPVPTGI